MTLIRLRWACIAVAAALCWTGCDAVDADKPLKNGTFTADVSGVVSKAMEGPAHYIVYGAGEDRTVSFFFLTDSSTLPLPGQTKYDPTGVFIRTRWNAQADTVMRLPANPELLFDRLVLSTGERFGITSGVIRINFIDGWRAVGDLSLVARDFTDPSAASFHIGVRFNATDVSPR